MLIDYFTLQELARCGYEKNNDLPEDWYQIEETRTNRKNGFTGKVFKNNDGEIVISYSGTTITSLSDIRNDLNMAFKNMPPQIADARQLYQDIKKKYPDYKITVTGHSLGGSLAQIIGAETGVRTVTYNAFGIGGSGYDINKDYSNITNIGDSRDWIFMSNVNKHLGKICVIPNDSGNILMPQLSLKLNYHNIEDMGTLLELRNYKRNSVDSFIDRMEKENTHPKLKNIMDYSANKFNERDNKFGFSNEQLKNPSYTSHPQNGRWVTIDGNHVFIEK